MKTNRYNKKRTEEQRKERLGKENINKSGLKCKIVEYNNTTDIIVEFEDGYRKKTTYDNFLKGHVENNIIAKQEREAVIKERTNLIIKSKEGYNMHIVEYINTDNVIVEFLDDYKAKVHTAYKNFKKGTVKNPYKVGKYGEVRGNDYPKNIYTKHFKPFNDWRILLHRVNEKEYYEKVNICTEWLYFKNFYEWLLSQENYKMWLNRKDYAIDKDILSQPNNKIYSPDTCCLVPFKINVLIRKIRNKNRSLPVGIQLGYNEKNKYLVSNSYPREYYDNINDAIKRYKEIKREQINMAAREAYNCGEITQKCYEGLINYNIDYLIEG